MPQVTLAFPHKLTKPGVLHVASKFLMTSIYSWPRHLTCACYGCRVRISPTGFVSPCNWPLWQFLPETDGFDTHVLLLILSCSSCCSCSWLLFIACSLWDLVNFVLLVFAGWMIDTHVKDDLFDVLIVCIPFYCLAQRLSDAFQCILLFVGLIPSPNSTDTWYPESTCVHCIMITHFNLFSVAASQMIGVLSLVSVAR